jgi:hypothetical protein
MITLSREEKLSWIFRIGLAMCFIGHGAFGIITKEAWLPFFGLVGFSRETAYILMPLIGMLDISLGVLVLFRPVRAAILYMAIWAIWTAALRPLTGDSVLEMLERAGNYGLPIAFLFLLGPVRTPRDWLGRANAQSLTPERETIVWHVMRATTALLLIGHGGLAMSQKGVLLTHASVLGFGSEQVVLAGAIEIALAIVVLLAPRPAVLVGIVAWKVGTEMLWPMSGAPMWEFIERGGSYASPLLLAMLAARRVAPVRIAAPRIAGLGPAAALLLFSLAPVAQAQDHAHSQQKDLVPINPPGILDSLKRGGYVIACRHAATNHDQQDHGPAREQQRNLSTLGEEQARTIGAVIRKLGIPIGEVRSSTVYRNRETAEYAFGSNVVDSVLTGGGLRRFLVAPVPEGTNRALVVRQGTIYDSMREFGITSTQEGDCFVTQPVDSTRYRILGRLRADYWKVGASQ